MTFITLSGSQGFNYKGWQTSFLCVQYIIHKESFVSWSTKEFRLKSHSNRSLRSVCHHLKCAYTPSVNMCFLVFCHIPEHHTAASVMTWVHVSLSQFINNISKDAWTYTYAVTRFCMMLQLSKSTGPSINNSAAVSWLHFVLTPKSDWF